METQRLDCQPSDHALGVSALEDPRGIVVHIRTEITARNETDVRNTVLVSWQNRPKPPKVILDLSGVNRIDSVGVGTLMDLAHEAKSAGVPFILCGLEESPRRKLDRTGLAGLFQIAESVEDALNGRTASERPVDASATVDAVSVKPLGRGTGSSVGADGRVRQHSHRGLWLCMIVVLVILAAGGAYGYVAIETYRNQLDLLPGMQGQLTAAGQRLDATEASLRAWNFQRDLWEGRLKKVEASVNGVLQSTRKQAEDINARAKQDLQATLDQRTQAIQSRIDAAQSAQQSTDARVTELQQQLDQAKAEYNQELARLRDDLHRQQTAQSGDIAALDRRVTTAGQRFDQNDRDLAAVHSKVDRERVDFELDVNHDRQLAPGISFALNHTDVHHQRFNGRVWLMPDRRTLWIRGQGLQQPLVFYTESDERPRELVITRVTRSAVAGYLLLPRGVGLTGALRDASASAQVAGVSRLEGDN